MQALNQQPTPRAYRPQAPASMAHADIINRACDELRERFNSNSDFRGLEVVDMDDEGVTIQVCTRWTSSTIGMQEQCNEIERALLIGVPELDLMLSLIHI